MKKITVCLLFFLFSLGCSRVPVAVKETDVLPPERVRPQVALIIDDAGYNLRALKPILDLPVRIDVAILPQLPYSSRIAEALHEKGFEVMLHQPMEPLSPNMKPGPGVILTSMDENKIKEVLSLNIQSIPYLSGVNNHMGSKVTSDVELMKLVLKTVNQHELFFVDSLTARSNVQKAAEAIGIQVLERDVFLDNEKDLELIKKQLRELKEIALKKGKAIGIGHFYPITIQAIAEILPEFEKDGVDIVPVSKLRD